MLFLSYLVFLSVHLFHISGYALPAPLVRVEERSFWVFYLVDLDGMDDDS